MIGKTLWKRLAPSRLRYSLALLRSDGAALKSLGWDRSFKEGMCVDRHGKPLPWYTYPAIRFLTPRIPASARVFEFGMGNSTLWWAKRAASVVTCEGSEAWFDRIAPKMPAHVTALLHDHASDDYVRAAEGRAFDILVIDGRRRIAACAASLPGLSAAGVVIWDNSDRDRYAEGYAMLAAAGFRRLDFWGMGPLTNVEWCTSVFYRPDNILAI